MKHEEFKRIPYPYSEEAERAVLGSILIEPDRVLGICSEKGVVENTFYIPAHRLLFEALLEMYEHDEPIDLLLVGVSMKNGGRLEQMGGYSFLEGLIDGTPTAAHAEYYIDMIVEKLRLRELKKAAEIAIDEVDGSDSTSSEIISDLTNRAVGLIKVKERVVTSESIVKCFEDAQGGKYTCVPTPWDGINRATGGPNLGMVTLFCGRGKSGKSMLKSYWHKYLGRRGIPALDCCFEDKTLIAKARCASSGVFSSSELFRGGRYIEMNGKFEWFPVRPDEIEKARECFRELDSLPMYWFDRRCTPKDLKTKLAEYKERYGIMLAFVDGNKDLLRPSGKYNDTGFDEECSQAIVEAADSLNIAVVDIHHLVKLEEDSIIRSGHIRGSANIVSDARLVYALQGDVLGSGLGEYKDAPPLSHDGQGYCTTRVFECIENNHGSLAKTWLDTDLGRCDFWPLRPFI